MGTEQWSSVKQKWDRDDQSEKPVNITGWTPWTIDPLTMETLHPSNNLISRVNIVSLRQAANQSSACRGDDLWPPSTQTWQEKLNGSCSAHWASRVNRKHRRSDGRVLTKNHSGRLCYSSLFPWRLRLSQLWWLNLVLWRVTQNTNEHFRASLLSVNSFASSSGFFFWSL